MRKAIVALLITLVGTIVLLNFKAKPAQLTAAAPPAVVSTARQTAPSGTATGQGGEEGESDDGSGSSGATAGPASPGGGSTSSPAAGTGTATGDAVSFQYGSIQVRATLRDGKVVDVQTVALAPVDGHSQAIDAQAEPLLRAEALSAQSAQIDAISGATYTSQAYAGSLQSAIDKVRGA